MNNDNQKSTLYKPGLLLFLMALTISACRQLEETVASRPNIIFIYADDLGYGDLGCYGQVHFSTPNIDQLASEGMLFTQHYAGSTVCAPSRCVLMTGKHTGNAFVRGNSGNPNGLGQLPLPPTEVTFPKLLQAAGYRTAACGKWGLGNADTEGNPLLHGFDHFFGYHDQVLAHNSYPEYLFRNNERIMLRNEVTYLSEEEWHRGLGSVSTEKVDYSNDLIWEEALGFIQESKEDPFFLYWATTIPHDNGEAPIGQRFEVPDGARYLEEDWTADEQQYAALVEHLDTQVGELLAALEELGIAENTMVIFTSDNGPILSDQLESNGPLRGGKRDLYEGGIRVPLLIRWPAQVEAGERSDHLSAGWDFFPTLCDAAGISDYPKTDGISFLPTLTGAGEQMQHEYLYWEFHWWKPARQAIRQANWKAVKDSLQSPIELYDLEQDPGETQDVSAEHPALVQELAQKMRSAGSFTLSSIENK
ncbi:MAG: arylsulfatase [Bacteroidota bacterium]